MYTYMCVVCSSRILATHSLIYMYIVEISFIRLNEILVKCQLFRFHDTIILSVYFVTISCSLHRFLHIRFERLECFSSNLCAFLPLFSFSALNLSRFRSCPRPVSILFSISLLKSLFSHAASYE